MRRVVLRGNREQTFPSHPLVHTVTTRRNAWDIFCHVVDNFGDVGVCWRLARQLASEHGLTVRLWVDNPASLARIEPQLDARAPAQQAHGVDVPRDTRGEVDRRTA